MPALPPDLRCGVVLSGLRDGDAELVARLGVPSCRVVLDWASVQPDGSGRLDLRAVEAFVDHVGQAGIEVTLSLFTGRVPTPIALEGGWLNRDNVDRAVDFAAAVADRLADRVRSWAPFDEPTLLGLAPIPVPLLDAVPAAHHALLAHGRAAIALRAAGATSIGCANHHAPMWPVSDDAADVGATKLFDALWNGLFTEAMVLGRYPADITPLMEPLIQPGDLATIRQPLDFYGVSYYAPQRIGATHPEAELPFELCETVGYPTTDLGWPVVPDSLREWLVVFRGRFRAALPPLRITGCGAAFADDTAPIDYLDAHLDAVIAARGRGVDVRGFDVVALRDSGSDAWGLVGPDGEPRPSFAWLAALATGQTPLLG